MAKTQVLEYTIYLPDQALVDSLNAQIAAGTGPGELLRAFNWQTLQMDFLGVLRAPYNVTEEGGAAVEFASEAGIYPPALPLELPTAPFTGPCIRSAWFGSGSNFPVNVATFTRKSGGWFGIPLLFGSTTKFYWVGKFAYAPPQDAVVDPGTGAVVAEPAPIPQRLMLCGFEFQSGTGSADGGANTAQINSFGEDSDSISRDASRWPGGIGYVHRPGNTSGSWNLQPHTTPATNGLWDRFYFRIRKLPTASRVMYEVESFATSGSGFKLYVTPTGALSLIGFPSSGDAQPQFTSAQTYQEGTWHRLDALAVLWGTSGPPERRIGLLEIWVDNENIGNGSIAPGGLAGNIKCSFTKVGDDSGSTDVQGEFDFDHWRTARLPKDKDPALAEWASGNGYTAGDFVQTSGNYGQRPSLTVAYKALTTHGSPSPDPASSPATWARVGHSQDWLHGSRVERIRVTGLSAANDGDWDPGLAGDDGAVLDHWPVGNISGTGARYFSTTSGAVLGVDTDAGELARIPGSLGAVSAVVARYGWKTTGAVSTVMAGIVSFVDGALPDVTVSGTPASEGTTNAPTWWSYLINLVNGTTETLAKVIENVEVRLTKGADANNTVAFAVCGLVEIIGNFGPEDQPPAANEALPATAHAKGLHNGPYRDSPWWGSLAPPFAPVLVSSGTYVSNGAARYLTFPLPPHFLFIRRVTPTGAIPAWWWPSMLNGHNIMDQRIDGYAFGKAEKDPTFVPNPGEDEQQERYRIRLISADPRVNENGVTYQYVALCDPAKRVCIAGSAGYHEDSYPFPSADPLEDASFTPIASFTFPEGLTANNTGRLAMRLSGHAAGAATLMSGSALTSYLNFAQGVMAGLANLFPSANIAQVPYVVFRTNDGNGDLAVWQYATYTGNGVSPRNIPVLPAGGGKLPLLAFGVGNNNGEYRDPSQTGLVSKTIQNGSDQATNGIRGGGVDFITVGSALNANAQTYHLFVLLGGTVDTDGDGFSDNGDFYQAEPDTPTFDDGWEEPEEYDPGAQPGEPLPPDTPGGDIGDDLDDAACVEPSTRLCNLALQRIGVSLQVTTLATEQSAEAVAIRTAYDESLDETLRAHRWPFATRYSTLTLVAGSAGVAATAEWQYAYALPESCLFPRRIVASRGRAMDPTPPPFREAQGLLFTNQAAAVLEYTIRPHCPALNGDATFRSAWMWRLAAELAPVLTRMPDKQTHALEMWQYTIGVAERFERLGAPGLRPAADPNDPDAGALVAKLQVINTALARIGAQTIADLTTEQSREAIAALLVYEDELRATLRDFAWPFATRYADAGLAVPTLTLVGGALDDPVVPDWYFAYRMPDDAIGVRRIVKHVTTTGVGRGWDPNPITFRMGSDDDGLLIYTNQEDAVVEYAIRPEDVWNVADPAFKDAFAWRMAAALSPSLATPDPEKEEATGQSLKVGEHPTKKGARSESGMIQLRRFRLDTAKWAWAMYERALSVAKAITANESQPEKPGDADWITGRN